MHPSGRRWCRAALGLVIVAVTALPASLAASAPHPTPTWHSEGTVPPLGVYLAGAACPTVTACLLGAQTSSLGGVMLASADAGRTFSSVSLPPGTPGIGAIACPSSLICFAVTSSNSYFTGGAGGGYEILKSVNGGASWHLVYVDPLSSGFGSNASLDSISCPTIDWCMAGGSGELFDATILVTSNGGGTWTDVSPFGPDNATVLIQSVSCPVAGSCIAVGDDATFAEIVTATTNGGITWSPESLPDGVSDVTGVACMSDKDCLATGSGSANYSLYRTTDFGGIWTQVAGAEGAELSKVTCIDATHCLAAGQVQIGSGSIGAVYQTSDGGSTWSALNVPKVATSILGLACGSFTSCTFQAENSRFVDLTMRLSGGKVVPSVHPYAIGPESIVTAGCPTPTTCREAVEVASSTGPYLGTTSASGFGGPWGPVTRLPGGNDIQDLVCPTTTRCVAAIYDSAIFPGRSYLDVSQNGGRTWTPKFAAPSLISSVSCASATSCVAVDGHLVVRTTDGGVAWKRSTLPSSDQFNQVACPTSDQCVAVGSRHNLPVELVSDDGGAAWSVERTGLGKQASLYEVACSSVHLCIAIGALSEFSSSSAPYLVASTDGGLRWRRRALRGLVAVESAGCTDQGICVATGLTSSFVSGLAISRDGGLEWAASPTPGAGVAQGATCGAHVCTLIEDPRSGGSELEAMW